MATKCWMLEKSCNKLVIFDFKNVFLLKSPLTLPCHALGLVPAPLVAVGVLGPAGLGVVDGHFVHVFVVI